MSKPVKWVARWFTTDGKTWWTKKPLQQNELARKLRKLMRRKPTAPNVRHIYIYPAP